MVTGNLLWISNPAFQAITADSLPPEKRGMGYSIQQLTLDLTSTPALLIAGLLFGYFGFVGGVRVAYVLVSLSYFVAGIIRFRLTETLENPEKIRLGELLRAFPLSYVEGARMLYRVPASLRNLILGNNVLALVGSLVGSYIIIYATTDLGISKLEWSIILTVQAVATTRTVIPIGKIIDVYGGKKMTVLFNALILANLALMMYANFHAFLVIMPLLGIAFSSSGAAFQKLTADLTQKNIRGKVSGMIRFTSLLVGAVGSLLGGLIYQNTAHANVFLISMLITTVGITVFWFLVHEPEIKER